MVKPLHETEIVWRNAVAACVSTVIQQPFRYAGWLNIPGWLPSPSHWHTLYPSSRWRIIPNFACQHQWTCSFVVTLHTVQFARTVRNSEHARRVFAMFAHLDITVATFMLVRTGIPSTPTSSSSNPVLSTLKQARTLKQAALSRMNSQAHTLKQDLARTRTGTVNNILLRMMNLLVFYNV